MSDSRPAATDPRGLSASAVLTFFRVYALQDLLLIAYLVILLALLIGRPLSAGAAHCEHLVYTALGTISVGAFVCRAPLLRSRLMRAATYRVSILGVLLANYLMLRDLLPVVRPDAVDLTLYHLDLRIFGVEPALWLERFNHGPTVEWFAFFYFSYFAIAIVFMVVFMWLRAPDRATTELAIGTILVFSIGQLGYMAVPGVGPGKFLASSFHGPLQGGFFWGCVMHVVSAGSAMKDVFPSLHTAVPTFFTLFMWNLAKRDRRWRAGAIVTGFFASNIIISTMLLRWHYAIDVVAGFALACAAGYMAPRLAALEAQQRTAAGMREPWDLGP